MAHPLDGRQDGLKRGAAMFGGAAKEAAEATKDAVKRELRNGGPRKPFDLADFKQWSGGFGPDEVDEADLRFYIKDNNCLPPKGFEHLKNEGNEPAATGFDSEQKTTTAQRADYCDACDRSKASCVCRENSKSKCEACGHESAEEWDGKCQGCGAQYQADQSGTRANASAEAVKFTCNKCGHAFQTGVTYEDFDPTDYPRCPKCGGEDILDNSAGLGRGAAMFNAITPADFHYSEEKDIIHDIELAKKKLHPGDPKDHPLRYELEVLQKNLEYVRAKKAKKNALENAVFTFTDQQGETDTVQAGDEEQAWRELARRWSTSVEDCKAMLKVTRENALENAPGSVYWDSMGVEDRSVWLGLAGIGDLAKGLAQLTWSQLPVRERNMVADAAVRHRDNRIFQNSLENYDKRCETCPVCQAKLEPTGAERDYESRLRHHLQYVHNLSTGLAEQEIKKLTNAASEDDEALEAELKRLGYTRHGEGGPNGMSPWKHSNGGWLSHEGLEKIYRGLENALENETYRYRGWTVKSQTNGQFMVYDGKGMDHDSYKTLEEAYQYVDEQLGPRENVAGEPRIRSWYFGQGGNWGYVDAEDKAEALEKAKARLKEERELTSEPITIELKDRRNAGDTGNMKDRCSMCRGMFDYKMLAWVGDIEHAIYACPDCQKKYPEGRPDKKKNAAESPDDLCDRCPHKRSSHGGGTCGACAAGSRSGKTHDFVLKGSPEGAVGRGEKENAATLANSGVDRGASKYGSRENADPRQDQADMIRRELEGPDAELIGVYFDGKWQNLKKADARKLDPMKISVAAPQAVKKNGLSNGFTFVDPSGAEERVEAQDEASAWQALAERLGATRQEMEREGIRLNEGEVRNGRACAACGERAENFCKKCGDTVCDACADKAGSTRGGDAYCTKCGSPERSNAAESRCPNCGEKWADPRAANSHLNPEKTEYSCKKREWNWENAGGKRSAKEMWDGALDGAKEQMIQELFGDDAKGYRRMNWARLPADVQEALEERWSRSRTNAGEAGTCYSCGRAEAEHPNERCERFVKRDSDGDGDKGMRNAATKTYVFFDTQDGNREIPVKAASEEEAWRKLARSNYQDGVSFTPQDMRDEGIKLGRVDNSLDNGLLTREEFPRIWDAQSGTFRSARLANVGLPREWFDATWAELPEDIRQRLLDGNDRNFANAAGKRRFKIGDKVRFKKENPAWPKGTVFTIDQDKDLGTYDYLLGTKSYPAGSSLAMDDLLELANSSLTPADRVAEGAKKYGTGA